MALTIRRIPETDIFTRLFGEVVSLKFRQIPAYWLKSPALSKHRPNKYNVQTVSREGENHRRRMAGERRLYQSLSRASNSRG